MDKNYYYDGRNIRERFPTETVCYPEGSLVDTAANIDALRCEENLRAAFRSGQTLEGVVTLCDNRLNLRVDLGHTYGIIKREDVSHTSTGELQKDIAVISRVGKVVCFKIIGFDRDEYGQIFALLSRKAAQAECLRDFLCRLYPGDIVPARVTHLEPFGAFVDIGCGVVSLLSIDCISVSRISHPRVRFSVGDNLRVAIREIDRETGRIYVTHKELLGSWEENAARFCVGQTVTGIIRSVETYGIFIELTPNLAGLAEYKENAVVDTPIAVYIKNIIYDRMKIKLVMLESGVLPNKIKIKPLYPVEYFTPEYVTHIDSWQYSPDGCGKTVETVF